MRIAARVVAHKASISEVLRRLRESASGLQVASVGFNDGRRQVQLILRVVIIRSGCCTKQRAYKIVGWIRLHCRWRSVVVLLPAEKVQIIRSNDLGFLFSVVGAELSWRVK